MNKKTILIAVWGASIIIAIISILKNPNSFYTNGTIIAGWLLFAVQLTWNQSERFYMKIKNMWFIAKNPDCIWNMQVEFTGEFDKDIFKEIDKIFCSKSTDYKIIQLSNARKIYKIKTLSYEVVTSPHQIRLIVEDLEVSYRRSKTIIQKEIGILLESLSRVLKEDKSDYYLTIDFKEYNPYFGFFVRRLNANEVNTFNVKFKVDGERVSINKTSIELHTESLQSFRSFSEEYLSLSPR
ncbi:hypothetical protein [Sporosarcina sp. P29]|uniref:hypothetical protein n=1 Tax=Sporosarcina sp. P29 TaxID=2048252 RepID=UPI000C162BDF|nr:hypothetical protein [Sporosarcina sp. P29]PID00805.1 hypothetical protein CSV68_00865 [Sporosarcina sp. P29]